MFVLDLFVLDLHQAVTSSSMEQSFACGLGKAHAFALQPYELLCRTLCAEQNYIVATVHGIASSVCPWSPALHTYLCNHEQHASTVEKALLFTTCTHAHHRPYMQDLHPVFPLCAVHSLLAASNSCSKTCVPLPVLMPQQ